MKSAPTTTVYEVWDWIKRFHYPSRSMRNAMAYKAAQHQFANQYSGNK